MSGRKVSHEYGKIPRFYQVSGIETCWKESAVDVLTEISVLDVEEELMKKQAICWQQILVVGLKMEKNYYK